jgi:hypothetical protein
VEPRSAKAGLGGNGAQLADKLLAALKEIYSRVSFEVERSYQVNRLRLEIAGARRQQEKLFRALGERVHRASKQGGAVPEGAKQQIAALDRLQQQIAIKAGEIEELNGRSAPAPASGWVGPADSASRTDP